MQATQHRLIFHSPTDQSRPLYGLPALVQEVVRSSDHKEEEARYLISQLLYFLQPFLHLLPLHFCLYFYLRLVSDHVYLTFPLCLWLLASLTAVKRDICFRRLLYSQCLSFFLSICLFVCLFTSLYLYDAYMLVVLRKFVSLCVDVCALEQNKLDVV